MQHCHLCSAHSPSETQHLSCGGAGNRDRGGSAAEPELGTLQGAPAAAEPPRTEERGREMKRVSEMSKSESKQRCYTLQSSTD